MSRFACLAPARSRAQQQAQDAQLWALSPRINPIEMLIIKRPSFADSRWETLPRSHDGKTRARRRRFLDRVSGRIKLERRGRRPRWRQGWYRRQQLRIRRKAHRGDLIWAAATAAAAERAAVVGAAYRIHGAAALATAVIVDSHFPQN